MAKQISDQRKFVYYFGMGLSVLGVLLFLSLIMGLFLETNRYPATDDRWMAFRGFLGVILAGIGDFIRRIGARGMAGSGVLLNPERARKDLEPYSRMAGGMVKDALGEVEAHRRQPPETIIKLKCTACGKLNEEDSKYCQECGTKL